MSEPLTFEQVDDQYFVVSVRRGPAPRPGAFLSALSDNGIVGQIYPDGKFQTGFSACTVGELKQVVEYIENKLAKEGENSK